MMSDDQIKSDGSPVPCTFTTTHSSAHVVPQVCQLIRCVFKGTDGRSWTSSQSHGACLYYHDTY